MQLFEFYSVVKNSTSQFVNNIKTQPIVEARNQKKTRKISNISLNTSSKKVFNCVEIKTHDQKKEIY